MRWYSNILEKNQDRTQSLFFQPKIKDSLVVNSYELEAEEMARNLFPTSNYDKSFFKSTQSISPISDKVKNEEFTSASIGLNNAGNPLNKDVKREMESKFSANFSEVRVHTDSVASGITRDLNASAFTMKNDIFFQASRYNPNSQRGKQLLAHELTHVIQQKNLTQPVIQKSELQAAEKDSDAIVIHPPKPTTAAAQMAKILEIAKKNATTMRGKCYGQFKKNVYEAGGYGDILNINLDTRFTGYIIGAVDFNKAVEANGAANLGLEEVSGSPSSATPGTILVLASPTGSHGISKTYGDISIIGGVEGSLLYCYNDGVMKLTGSEKSWQAGGYNSDLEVRMYRPIDRN